VKDENWMTFASNVFSKQGIQLVLEIRAGINERNLLLT